MIFFELSYLMRFLWDEIFNKMLMKDDSTLYSYLMLAQTVLILDGVSFLVLLLFHRMNFTENFSTHIVTTNSNDTSL